MEFFLYLVALTRMVPQGDTALRKEGRAEEAAQQPAWLLLLQEQRRRGAGRGRKRRGAR